MAGRLLNIELGTGRWCVWQSMCP